MVKFWMFNHFMSALPDSLFLIKHMENEIKEFDVNPLILTSDGCIAVDALVVSN